MLRQLQKFGVILIVFLIQMSCVKDVDFDQARDLLITPALEVSLVRFDEPAPEFVDSGVEQTVLRDSIRIEIFNDPFLVDNLKRAEFLFETTNSINRAFDAEIQFLDDDDALQHLIEFGVQASQTNQDIVNITEEIFENEAVSNLTSTTKIVFAFTLQASNDGSVLDENSLGNLRLWSKGAFYIDLISPGE